MGVQVTNDGPVHVLGEGWTLQAAQGGTNLHHLCPDTYLSPADAEALRQVALNQGRTAWEYEVSQGPWASWYVGLSPARKVRQWAAYVGHPPMA